MSQIGYYNYYNNPHRYSPTEVVDRYQEMVDRATGDKLYDLMTGKTTLTGTDYESITNRELTINTKGYFTTKV